MKQTIPFKKDITFKTKIGELTSISLDNDLTLKGEDLITGNFYITGTYKMIESSALEEEYSYKIPCEIAISDDYDTYDAQIDIDDFYYEIINDEILRVNIVVVINNLERKSDDAYLSFLNDDEEILQSDEKSTDIFFEDVIEQDSCADLEVKNEEMILENNLDEVKILDEIPEIVRDSNSFLDVKEEIKKQEDTYLTYKVYIFKRDDTIAGILEKYSISKEQLEDYNNLDEIGEGTKLVIPSFND